MISKVNPAFYAFLRPPDAFAIVTNFPDAFHSATPELLQLLTPVEATPELL
jgi:hypothetical protein